MNTLIGRCRRGITLSLLLLNVSGARAISVYDPCQRSQDFFGPSLSFRGVVATVLHQEFTKQAQSQHSLGERSRRFTSQELENTSGNRSLAEVQILPPATLQVTTGSLPRREYVVWKLPTDLSPVKPPHLHSKK